MMRPFRCLFAAVLAAGLLVSPVSAGGPSGPVQPMDVARPADLPAIGKWMIGPDGQIAHWLGQIVDGKALREPINVIIIDCISASPEEAVRRIEAAASAAGYPVRFGHSAGYRAMIGDRLIGQIPSNRDSAFSNDLFELTNNHGRMFGPYQFANSYIFTGAFSRERVRVEPLRHAFDSFIQARDDFSRQLSGKSEFKLSGVVNLGNAIVGEPEIGTADHDGFAVLLRTTSH
ncbi:MAG: hypothetical protein ACR2JJ_06620 [Sphingomicrobium sp.]